jgi:hypothetical protein
MTEAVLSVAREGADRLIRFHAEAEQKNEWTFFVDEMYHPDCVYTCEYAGTMVVAAAGIDQIKATHYGRDMLHGWEGWSFPYMGVYVDSDSKIITHWMNRGPGKKPDGSFYETPGVSFIEFTPQGKIIRQLDMFDLAHQMNLCDQLEEAGLLSAALKENWVLPMKTRLIEMLQHNMS